MPEGDTIFRLASKLSPALSGREVLSFSARRLTRDAASSVVGHRIAAVDAKGKNLLFRFDDARVLHIHLRMQGRIFFERPRSAFWKPVLAEPDLRLVVAGASVLGRHLSVVRLLAREETAHDLMSLGPELLREGWNEDEALHRLRALDPTRTIAEALLLQRVVAGIGNEYKSEVLFLERVRPNTPVGCLDDDVLRGLLQRASALLRQNVGDGPRTTRPTLAGSRLWVYGRGGRPCFRCSTPVVSTIDASPSGLAGRRSYYCPRCQP